MNKFLAFFGGNMKKDIKKTFSKTRGQA